VSFVIRMLILAHFISLSEIAGPWQTYLSPDSRFCYELLPGGNLQNSRLLMGGLATQEIVAQPLTIALHSLSVSECARLDAPR